MLAHGVLSMWDCSGGDACSPLDWLQNWGESSKDDSAQLSRIFWGIQSRRQHVVHAKHSERSSAKLRAAKLISSTETVVPIGSCSIEAFWASIPSTCSNEFITLWGKLRPKSICYLLSQCVCVIDLLGVN